MNNKKLIAGLEKKGGQNIRPISEKPKFNPPSQKTYKQEGKDMNILKNMIKELSSKELIDLLNEIIENEKTGLVSSKLRELTKEYVKLLGVSSGDNFMFTIDVQMAAYKEMAIRYRDDIK